jgi:hypothetical protein
MAERQPPCQRLLAFHFEQLGCPTQGAKRPLRAAKRGAIRRSRSQKIHEREAVRRVLLRRHQSMESFQGQYSPLTSSQGASIHFLAVEFGEDGKEVFTLQLPPILFLFGKIVL